MYSYLAKYAGGVQEYVCPFEISLDSSSLLFRLFRLKKLDDIDKYMAENNNQLPSGADEKYRAKLQEQHFRTTDATTDFINKESLSKIIHGILAFREPITVKDLEVNCNTAKQLTDRSYRVRIVRDPPKPPRDSPNVNNPAFQTSRHSLMAKIVELK